MEHTLVHLDADDSRWRSFVQQHARSPLQLGSWLDVLIRAYRLRARVAALADGDGTIAAALPMIRSKVPWRHRWTALPFTDNLEPVAIDKPSRDELLAAIAREHVDEPVVVRSEVRAPGWTARQLGTMQVVDLTDGAAGVLRGASSATRRGSRR